MEDLLKNFAVFCERGKCICVVLASVERPSAKMAPFFEGLRKISAQGPPPTSARVSLGRGRGLVITLRAVHTALHSCSLFALIHWSSIPPSLLFPRIPYSFPIVPLLHSMNE